MSLFHKKLQWFVENLKMVVSLETLVHIIQIIQKNLLSLIVNNVSS